MLKAPKSIVLLSLITSIVLMGAKFIAYSITNSNAILTDGLESIVNVVASAFAFYSIHLSSRPKDENHPYGHGKVEFFSAFLEGGLILLAGILIVGKSIYSLFFPVQIEHILDGMGILALTGIVNFVLGRYMIQKSKGFNSIVLYADGKHLQTDAYSTLGLLVGLGLFYNGYKLLRKSIGGLMDESDVEIVTKIISILQDNRRDAWIDVHNLRIQRYGPEIHVDCHLTLPYYFSLIQVHDEVSSIDKLINRSTSFRTEFFIHADPCVPQCCHYCNMKNCPVRFEEKRMDIDWNLAVVTRNLKHFESMPEKGVKSNGNKKI